MSIEDQPLLNSQSYSSLEIELDQWHALLEKAETSRSGEVSGRDVEYIGIKHEGDQEIYTCATKEMLQKNGYKIMSLDKIGQISSHMIAKEDTVSVSQLSTIYKINNIQSNILTASINKVKEDKNKGWRILGWATFFLAFIPAIFSMIGKFQMKAKIGEIGQMTEHQNAIKDRLLQYFSDLIQKHPEKAQDHDITDFLSSAIFEDSRKPGVDVSSIDKKALEQMEDDSIPPSFQPCYCYLDFLQQKLEDNQDNPQSVFSLEEMQQMTHFLNAISDASCRGLTDKMVELFNSPGFRKEMEKLGTQLETESTGVEGFKEVSMTQDSQKRVQLESHLKKEGDFLLVCNMVQGHEGLGALPLDRSVIARSRQRIHQGVSAFNRQEREALFVQKIGGRTDLSEGIMDRVHIFHPEGRWGIVGAIFQEIEKTRQKAS